MAARKSTDRSSDKSSDAVEQVLRLFTILHLVASRRDGQRIGRAQLARACECDIRTVIRAFILLREAQIPLDYDDVARTYTLPDKGWALTTSTLTASDVLALTLACSLLADETTPFAEQTRTALEKVTMGMPHALRQLLEQTKQALQISGGMARDYSRAPLRLLLTATARRQTVEMLYDSRNSGLTERRLVDPYRVDMRDGRYLDMQAWCHKDRRVKTFAVDRVLEARMIDRKFSVQPWDDSDEGVIGGIRDGAWIDVTVRFDSEVAPYARDRTWPFDATFTNEEDGGVILQGKVRGTAGIVRELLSWRRHAVVLGGPELRARMAEEVQAMAAHYDDPEKIEKS